MVYYIILDQNYTYIYIRDIIVFFSAGLTTLDKLCVAEELPDLRMRRANYQLVKGSKRLGWTAVRAPKSARNIKYHQTLPMIPSGNLT